MINYTNHMTKTDPGKGLYGKMYDDGRNPFKRRTPRPELIGKEGIIEKKSKVCVWTYGAKKYSTSCGKLDERPYGCIGEIQCPYCGKEIKE